MAQEPLRRPSRNPARPADEARRPKIWAEGGQRPPFDPRALARASLVLSRTGVAPLLAWSARQTRQGALQVKDGRGRLPAEKLGRAARFVPSYLRVAGWIKTVAAILAHASASADPNVARGNALVAEIEPHLWDKDAPKTNAPPDPAQSLGEAAPVVLPEPMQPGDDPLAAIRDDLEGRPAAERKGWLDRIAPEGPALPPPPPGPVATTAIQVSGYLLGWATAILALPYGLGHALWLYAKGVDLRGIGRED